MTNLVIDLQNILRWHESFWSEEIWSKNILYTKIMTPKKLRPKSLVKIIPVTAEIQPTRTNVARAYVLPGYMSPYQNWHL